MDMRGGQELENSMSRRGRSKSRIGKDRVRGRIWGRRWAGTGAD